MDGYKTMPTMLRVTTEMGQKIRGEFERTDVGSVEILKSGGVPEGLSVSLLDRLKSPTFDRLPERIKESHYLWLVDAYAKKPDCPRVEITEEMRLKLEEKLTQAGVGPRALIGQAKEKAS